MQHKQEMMLRFYNDESIHETGDLDNINEQMDMPYLSSLVLEREDEDEDYWYTLKTPVLCVILVLSRTTINFTA